MYIQHTSCCGVRELCSIHTNFRENGPLGILKVINDTVFIPEQRFVLDPNTGRNINNPLKRHWGPGCGHYIFTDHHAYGTHKKNKYVLCQYGKSFAKFILKNKLGKLTCSQSATNPNTHNKITVWVWTFDSIALRDFCSKQWPWEPKPDPVKKEEPKVQETRAPAPAPARQMTADDIRAAAAREEIPLPAAPRYALPSSDKIERMLRRPAHRRPTMSDARRAYRRAQEFGRPVPEWATERLSVAAAFTHDTRDP